MPDPRIRVLPPELADQIAAGEVVERPASVVKELVENALDAGARRIDVDVEGGGRRLVRVVDDGGGMSPEEARLALRRHATSKLTSLAELFELRTMGFRGEALPSIAAVSRFVLVTRMGETTAGFRLEVEAGRERDAGEIGAPVGTQVEVRDLLYNVPARLKFLKAESTEAAHVTEAVTRLALAHPEVHFRLRHGGRLALEVPPHRSLLERIEAVVGRRLAGRIHPAELLEGGVRVTAFLAPPDEAQATSRGISLFVGPRWVRDRGLLHAVNMGYGELVPHGRYPTALVFVDPPVGAVDVNVHPQKVEVRFSRPQEVYSAVRHAVAQAVARAPWLEEAPGSSPVPVTMMAMATAPPVARLSDVGASYAATQERSLFTFRPPPPQVAALERRVPAPAPGGSGEFFGRLVYLGQLAHTYLVCESEGELVLIDQHAAHERIAFQRLREAFAENRPRTQRMLFPRTIELGETEAAAAEANAEALGGIGFELSAFGGASFALTAAPADLRDEDVEPTLRELLVDMAETTVSRAVDERMDAVFATVACHSVVRAGDVLTPSEAQALLCALDGIDFRAHCPHGRPVLLRISVAEIARRFGRT